MHSYDDSINVGVLCDCLFPLADSVALRIKLRPPVSGGLVVLLTGLEAVLQADRTVEYQMLRGGILAVRTEIAQTHELVGFTGLSML